MTEALRLLNLTEEICRDIQVPSQKTSQSPLFPSEFGIISSETAQSSCKEGGPTCTMGISRPATYVQTAPRQTILICYVGEHESAHQVSGVGPKRLLLFG
jgi:hypothetical protein